RCSPRDRYFALSVSLLERSLSAAVGFPAISCLGNTGPPSGIRVYSDHRLLAVEDWARLSRSRLPAARARNSRRGCRQINGLGPLRAIHVPSLYPFRSRDAR